MTRKSKGKPSVEGVFRRFLRPYQRRFIQDRSKRIICLKSRRIGMSEAVVVMSILLALSERYHDVYLCSTNYGNAKELLRRCGRWLEAFEAAGLNLGVVQNSKTTIEFSNGSRIIPMPLLAVRSRTGTVILDEYAFALHDREAWAGISPVALTNPNMRIILISTPFGASGMFWEIWTDPSGEHGDWSRHHIDIYQAATEGFPVNPEELRTQYSSDVWAQEFLCQFLSDINQYFPHDLIRRCAYDVEELPGSTLPSGELFAGIDLASVQDASVFGPAIESGEDFWLRPPTIIKPAGNAMDYTEQFQRALDLLRSDPYSGVSVDATGEGAQFGQDLRREFGWRAINEVGGGEWKNVYELVPQMRLAMERGKLHIPRDPRLMRAFAKIQRTQTTQSNIKYTAQKDAEGHADEFSAALLAYHAAQQSKRTQGSSFAAVAGRHGRISPGF